MWSNSRQTSSSGRQWPPYDRLTPGTGANYDLRPGFRPSTGQGASFTEYSSRDRDRDRERERDKDREREVRDRDKERERDVRDRDKERERERDRDRESHSYNMLCQSLNSSICTPPPSKRSCSEDSRTVIVSKELKVERPKKVEKKKPAKVSWGFKKDILLLEYYKDHRNLWDTGDGNFGNAEITKKSLSKLAKELNCKVSNVRTRFRKFRERFLFEVNKLENAERLGSEYTVSWKYFSCLLFLLGKKSFEAGIVKAEIVLDDVDHPIQEIKKPGEKPATEQVETPQEKVVPTNNNQISTENCLIKDVKVEIVEEIHSANTPVMNVESRLDITQANVVSSTPRVSASPVVASSPAISASPAIPPAEEVNSASVFCPNNSFQMTENVHLDSELFGKQVAIHLNNLSPYYREISKLRIQEIMVHFALRSQGFHPPVGLRSTASQPNNSQME